MRGSKGFNNNNKRRQQTFSGETKLIGEYMHSCGDLIVCKLLSKNIPYPNSPVLVDNKQIGKIDEIFGAFDDPHVSIQTENKDLHKKGIKFEGYKEKFMFRERLLPREQQIAQKEQEDKEKKKNEKFGNKFDKNKNSEGKKNFYKKKEFKSEKFDRIKKKHNLK